MEPEPPKDELQEKDFIRKSNERDPMPLWLWGASLLAVVALLWGVSSWYYKGVEQHVGKSPFLQVTNRELSLFLWQFPQHMRQHVRERQHYLPAFEYIDRVGIAEGAAEQYAIAPPELLFLYHTWDRLIRREFSPRAIPKVEFLQFLNSQPEWRPDEWPAAPKGYQLFVSELNESSLTDLAKAAEKSLPKMVRMAFEGWKNYFLEGEAINNTEITVLQMEKFLQSHPHYARNDWRNIVFEEYPNYLKLENSDKKALLTKEQITPFLRQAYYNFISE